MLQEEEPESMKAVPPQWPPPGHAISRPQGFMGKVSMGKGPGGRPVEWPPRPEPNADQDQPDQVASSAYNDQVPPPVPPRPANYPQINNAPNMTTTYPSGFKFKENAPVDHSVPVKVVMSQPAFKISQPIRRRGDDKWPPKGFGEPVQEEVREFIKPKKMQRDYGGFFSQNALPNNYAGYRPPPGTQHFGTDENDEEEVEAGVSNM
ncbi:uncharacterized protein LOC121869768 isoform X3 [Homarus americanus]|uniref:uncharacterized protein LOC121869768 isoform X3 n=1 Tax=Homarus americanus TaxID=6706 RepID=UPI001C46BC68|nr:uncharacterized protein LOC121869768 isoform X3 [Homarus americanus]